MKKIIMILIAINILLAGLVGGLYFLAETYPFHPGDALFGVQTFAENQRVRLMKDSVSQAEMRFELVERRLADLAMVSDVNNLKTAVVSFDRSLTAAIDSLAVLPPEDAEPIFANISALSERAELVISSIEDQVDEDLLVVLESKLAAIQTSSSAVLIPITGETPSFYDGLLEKMIPFLGNDVDHGDFPLNGGHADIDCLACHEEGVYTDTPTTCNTCHELEQELAGKEVYVATTSMISHENYPEKYSEDCASCHTVDRNWTRLEFDHQGVRQCMDCHAEDTPQLIPVTGVVYTNYTVGDDAYAMTAMTANHYEGTECADCHTDTEDWHEAAFDHYQSNCQECHANVHEDEYPFGSECKKVESCETCHSYTEHEEDYYGSCTNCHNDLEDWLVVDVDHTGYDNCFDCHTDDRPADHYYSNCSTCHNTEDWSQGYFNHDPTSTCTTCHTAPEGHYGDDCATCHSMETWENGLFPHTFDNCSSCHNTPANHYPATCTTCHTTSSWHKISVDHGDLVLCSDCHDSPGAHYEGACLNCHDVNTWVNVDFNHAGLSDCMECHSAPSGHYGGSCSNCHTTNNWGEVNFDHSGLTYCEGCHTGPDGHYTSSCSDCHNTVNWSEVNFSHGDETSSCQSCHEKEGHWPGSCSRCHETSSWDLVDFDHSTNNYSDCKACHAQDRPSGHTRGQCSRCHDTEDWGNVSPDPYIEPTPTPDDEDAKAEVVEPTALPTIPVVGPPTEEPKPTEPPAPVQLPTQPPPPGVEPTQPPVEPTEPAPLPPTEAPPEPTTPPVQEVTPTPPPPPPPVEP